MIYLVDTNVLLRFVDGRHALHSSAREALRNLRQDGHEFRITPQNCAEFWNVATRPAMQNGLGLGIKQSHRILSLIERLFPLLPSTNQDYTEWRRLIVRYNVSGVQTHDARLIAAMLPHRINHILTFNFNDFDRYKAEGIVPIDPVTV